MNPFRIYQEAYQSNSHINESTVQDDIKDLIKRMNKVGKNTGNNSFVVFAKELSGILDRIHKGLGVKESTEVLQGGKADGKTLEDLAKHHGVPLEDIQKEFDLGMKVELEHTTDKEIAKEITTDHIWEMSNYYSKLKKMEGESIKVERLGSKNRDYKTSDRDISNRLKEHKVLMDEYIANGMTKEEASKKAHDDLFGESTGRDARDWEDEQKSLRGNKSFVVFAELMVGDGYGVDVMSAKDEKSAIRLAEIHDEGVARGWIKPLTHKYISLHRLPHGIRDTYAYEAAKNAIEFNDVLPKEWVKIYDYKS